jgi:hypothetical protein
MKTIKLHEIIKDWDDFRLESLDNLFEQCKYGRMCAFYEASETYKHAIDKHTQLYMQQLKYRGLEK